MKLFISKTCKACEKVKDLDKKFPQITKYYVENGKVKVGKRVYDVDELPGVPALIVGKYAYMTAEAILDFTKTLESGEK
jgi:hypothetical protein